ncbi:MAG TPA: hypothetical protein VG105_04075 [Paraburkholderia sp.]|jgi:hypothetical protein|nr:hypothetical protein [Paraburkholderia sp.]
MPTSEHKFSVDELIEALLRDQGIHEGFWALNVEFLATGTSVNSPAGSGKTLPGMIVSVNSATLVRAENSTHGAVNAALANPPKRVADTKPVRARKPNPSTLQ